jgi:hypothetical protein
MFKGNLKWALGFLLILAACASYQTKVKDARNLMKQGKPMAAAEKLKPLAEETGDDQLVYLLDYATALQAAGDYKESIKNFAAAEKLVDLNDYHSISKIAAATLTSEDQIQYKAESYEKLFINVYQAINYTMIHQFDEAMVEARRINEKIQKFRLDGRETYELNPFAHYLAAMLWEADGKYDDAYISYQDSYKIDASNPLLAEDLLRTSKKSRRMDEYQQWRQKYPDVHEDPASLDPKRGALIVMIQQGWGPEKRYSRYDNRIAKLYPVRSDTTFAELEIEGLGRYDTKTVYDVEGVAIKTFDEDRAWAIARKVGGTVAKAIVADQVRQKNETLGFLTAVALRISDHADLRQWSTLPRHMQIARVWLPEGTYKVGLQGKTGSNFPTADYLAPQSVQITAGKTQFLFWRTLR